MKGKDGIMQTISLIKMNPEQIQEIERLEWAEFELECDLERALEQLAQTNNDPNMTITTTHEFDLF